MPYYKAQHEVFVRAIIRHGDQLLAYRQAYPKATKESAYTAAIRLLRQTHIAQRVAGAQEHHAVQARQRAQERAEHKQRLEDEDILQKRAWLARVVRREITRPRYFNLNGRIVLVQEDLHPSYILRAIELDTKYEYRYSPRIILDRQFARLYEQASHPVGLALLARFSNPGYRERRPTPAVILSEVQCNETERRIRLDDVLCHTAATRQILRSAQNDNLDLTSKRLTQSNGTPRPTIYTANNKPAKCNKVKMHPVQTTKASVMQVAELMPAPYTVIIDAAHPPCHSERSATQRRTCLISDTAESQEIYLGNNDFLSGLGERGSPAGRNDSFDSAAKRLTDSKQNPPRVMLSPGNKTSSCNKMNDTAESREISPCSRNDGFGGPPETGMSNGGVKKNRGTKWPQLKF